MAYSEEESKLLKEVQELKQTIAKLERLLIFSEKTTTDLLAHIESAPRVWLCYDGDKLAGASHQGHNPWQGGLFEGKQIHAVPVEKLRE